MEDVKVDESSNVHDEATNNRENDSVHFLDLISMQEDQRDRKAGHEEEGREEVARVLPAAVAVAPDVPAVAHAAEDVGHRHKDVRDDRDERIPVLGDGARKDVEEKAECDETGKRNDNYDVLTTHFVVDTIVCFCCCC